MIIITLGCLLTILVCFSIGTGFVDLYGKVTGRTEAYSFIETLLIGLCVTGSIVCISSIWLPSGTQLAIVLAILSVFYIAIFKLNNIVSQVRRLKKKITVFQSVLISGALLMLFLFTLVPPQFPDVYIYHIQNIMWNEGYSVVPGLANIEERFGFNSNMFLLSSLFGFRPLTGEFIYIVNALCTFLVLVYIIRHVAIRKSYVFALFSLIYVIFFMIYKTHIGCSSTDLLPNLFIIFILYLVLSDPGKIEDKSLLFLLLPLYCVTLKVSSIFICLIPLYLFIVFFRKKDIRTTVFIITSAILIILPWLVRNVIISGYLIHPYPAVDLFSFDWKLPVQYAIESNEYVKAFAITMDVWGTSTRAILDLPISDKISLWIMEKHPLDVSILIVGLLSIVAMVLLTLCKRQLIKEKPELFLVWIVGLCGFMFLLLTAPAIRFGFGFVAIVFAMPFFLFFDNRKIIPTSASINRFIITIVFLYLSVLSVRYFLSIKEDSQTYLNLAYKPQGIKSHLAKYPVKKDIFYINEVSFTKVKKGNCGNLALPCGYCLDEIDMRGTSLQEGFRTRKPHNLSLP